jgi:spore photoproduct lyase
MQSSEVRPRVCVPRETQKKIAGGLLRVEKIYHEPAVERYGRGRKILARLPDAQRTEVPSHCNVPELHGDSGGVANWNRTKKSVLVLGTKKDVGCRPFYRSWRPWST